jgi:predicted PurR-regulated permease PerM
MLCLTIGAVFLGAYLLIGLPYAVVLALIAGLMEAIPVFGPTLGAIPAILVALSIEPRMALWVVAATIVIQLVENNWLVPRIMNKAVGVNPMVVLLALVTLASLLGLPGVLLAIPLAAVVQLLLDRFVWSLPAPEQRLPDGRDRLSKLRYEAQELGQDARKQLKAKDALTTSATDEVEDTIEAIAADLDRLLEQLVQEENFR